MVVLSLKTDLPSGFEKIQVENVINIDTVEHDNSQKNLNQNIPNSDQSSHSSSTLLNASDNIAGTENDSLDNNSLRKETTEVLVDQLRSNTPEILQNTANMPLSLEAILSSVIDFSSQSQSQINQFIANADMMITLAIDQTDTVLGVIRARLANASALGDISNKSWPQIKQSIRSKYIRSDIPFETAQEKLLAI